MADAKAWLASLEEDGPVLPKLRALLVEPLSPPRGASPRGCLMGNTTVEVTSEDDAAMALVRQGFDDFEQAVRVALERAHRTGELSAPATLRRKRRCCWR